MRPCCAPEGEPAASSTGVSRRAYRGLLSDLPADDTPGLDKDPVSHRKEGKFLPPDALSPVLDPDFVPDDDPTTAEAKRAREHPEETGS